MPRSGKILAEGMDENIFKFQVKSDIGYTGLNPRKMVHSHLKERHVMMLLLLTLLSTHMLTTNVVRMRLDIESDGR